MLSQNFHKISQKPTKHTADCGCISYTWHLWPKTPIYFTLIYYILRYIVFITYWYYLKIYVNNYNIVYTKSKLRLQAAYGCYLANKTKSLGGYWIRAAHCKPGCKDCTSHITHHTSHTTHRSDCWNLPRRTNHFTWHVNVVNPYKENA